MRGINKAIILGTVGRDPEVRTIGSGKKIASLSLATSEKWANGETKTEWHRVSVMNDRVVEIVEQYVRKGSKLYVEGKIKTRKWTDQSGAEKYSTEIVVEAFGGSIEIVGDPAGGRDDAPAPQQARAAARQAVAPAPDLDDEIPF